MGQTVDIFKGLECSKLGETQVILGFLFHWEHPEIVFNSHVLFYLLNLGLIHWQEGPSSQLPERHCGALRVEMN